MQKPIRPTELPRYVGYAEIEETTGIDKRQIQRLMVQGKFPRPDGIPTKENRWRLTVILEWLEARNAREIADIQTLAQTDPAKLKPEQVAPAIGELVKQFARQRGIDLTRGHSVTLNLPVGDPEARRRLFDVRPGWVADAASLGAQMVLTDENWREAACLLLTRLTVEMALRPETPLAEVMQLLVRGDEVPA